MSETKPITGHFETDGVDLHHYRHGKFALLTSAVIFVDSEGRRNIAHHGLLTDGRSGKIGYYIIGSPFRTPYLEAYVVHDWWCAKAKTLKDAARTQLRLRADVQLRDETLVALGACRANRVVTYAAVRAHAWRHRNDPVADWSVDFISEAASHGCKLSPPELRGAMEYKL